MKKIIVEIPTRVDLAGGTLDIWPIYLLHNNCYTINIAIDLKVLIEFEKIEGDNVFIELNDQNEEVKLNNIDDLPEEGLFILVNHIVKYFQPDYAFRLKIRIDTPAGSGLGTSSSLSLGLCKAFLVGSGKSIPSKKLIELAMSLETQILQFPTGNQDYLAAFYGGINAWKYEPTGWRREKFSINAKELIDRSVLCYVGTAHNSALSNWSVFKARLEKNPKVISNLEGIKEAALLLRKALINKDWFVFAEALEQEWENRKYLSQLILTPEMEKAIEISKGQGALAVKGCGAANGGSLYIFTVPEKKIKIANALSKAGFEVLNFNISPFGLKLLNNK